MPIHDPHHWASFDTFDPSQATVVRRPEKQSPGYWAGAPTVLFDAAGESFYLVYRLRRPRGVQPDRGAQLHIARSSDGVAFEDIWTGTKDQLDSTSIERCALAQTPQGGWRLYVSYVDPADRRWRIDRVDAPRPDQFDLRSAQRVLTADDVTTEDGDVEGVKDPFVFQIAGLYHMVVSFATADTHTAGEQLHRTADCYNTGLIRSRSGLATSEDGIQWQWEGEILGPSQEGWDKYCARIGCLWQQQGIWLALYDGSADVSENYEERCGLAYSTDLRHFHRISRQGPLLTPLQDTGALRYFDLLQLPAATYIYYEMAQPDGSHDLRVLRRP